MNLQAIIYCRVSTKEQGVSGLGLGAQLDDATQFCVANNVDVIQVFNEVQSGKDNLSARPILTQALELCRRKNYLLIVSKLDRLSRNVHAIAGLMESKVMFKVAQLGWDADNFQLHLFAALAEKEREWISKRTKDALAKKKANGGTLGNLASMPKAQTKSAELRNKLADEFAEKYSSFILTGLAEGKSLNSIAGQMNSLHIKTVKGGRWTAETVKRVAARITIRMT